VSKIRFGVIGCGNISDKLVIPSIIEYKNTELVAVASRDNIKAEKYRNKFFCKGIVGYDELLKSNEIDAVYISLPPSLHKIWTIKALNCGKHVLIEKPSSTCYKDSEEMVKLADKKHLILMENYMFEYHSQQNYVKNMISNQIGKIRLFRSSFGFPLMNKDNFRYKRDLGGGVLLDAGGYPVKATKIFLGEELKVEYAKLNTEDNYEVDMFGCAILTNEKNVVSQIAFGFDNFYQCNYEIWGNKGKIIVNRAFTAGPNIRPKVIIEKQDIRKEIILPSDNHCINILDEFTKCIINKEYGIHKEEILNQARIIDEIRNYSKMVGEY
jgi:predicted dehydrogenase